MKYQAKREWPGVTLYHADCLETLPIQADAVITDPPYGLAEKWKGGGGSGGTSWNFNPLEAKGWDGSTTLGLELHLDRYREIVVWGGNYYSLPISRCWFLWDKKMNDDFTTGQAEMAWTNLDRPIRVFRYAQCELANEGPKLHPTQKPIALMIWCLKWITGQTILDPFMGSGTTGIACIRTGRKFIGIEKDARYFQIACERIERELSQGQLFEPTAICQPKQAMLM